MLSNFSPLVSTHTPCQHVMPGLPPGLSLSGLSPFPPASPRISAGCTHHTLLPCVWVTPFSSGLWSLSLPSLPNDRGWPRFSWPRTQVSPHPVWLPLIPKIPSKDLKLILCASLINCTHHHLLTVRNARIASGGVSVWEATSLWGS